MIEAVMCISLAAMGFYFFKSTDLPKDMKERSAQMRSQGNYSAAPARKMVFEKQTTTTNIKVAATNVEATRDQKLAELEKAKRAAEMKLRVQQIDDLTLAITALEQELKVNNARNVEIQAEIDAHLETLRTLTA